MARRIERWQQAGIPLTKREPNGFGGSTSHPTADAVKKTDTLLTLLSKDRSLARAIVQLWRQGFEVEWWAVRDALTDVVADARTAAKRREDSPRYQRRPTHGSAVARAWQDRARDIAQERPDLHQSSAARHVLEDAVTTVDTYLSGDLPDPEGESSLMAVSGMADLAAAEGFSLPDATGIFETATSLLGWDTIADAIGKVRSADDLDDVRAEMRQVDEVARTPGIEVEFGPEHDDATAIAMFVGCLLALRERPELLA